MKKGFVLAGLFINLIGVVFLFFGLRVEKEGVLFSSRVGNGEFKDSHSVSQRPVLLNIGLALICLGTLLQMIGTY
jgi:uncharacterized membrane protein